MSRIAKIENRWRVFDHNNAQIDETETYEAALNAKQKHDATSSRTSPQSGQFDTPLPGTDVQSLPSFRP